MYGDIHVHVHEGNVILNYNNYKFCVQILFWDIKVKYP